MMVLALYVCDSKHKVLFVNTNIKRLLPGRFRVTIFFYTQGGIFVFWYKLSREMIEKRRKNSGKSVLLKDL